MNINFVKKIKLPKIATDHPVAFWVAVVLHLSLLFGLFFSNIQRWETPPKKIQKASKPIPKAITVDLKEIKAEKQRLVDIEKKRVERLSKLKADERKIENERYKEQQRLKKLKAKTQKEKKANVLAEKQRKSAEEKARKAKEKAKQEENKEKLAKQKALEAEKKKREIEQQRKAQAKKFKKEQASRKIVKEVQTEEDQERKNAQRNILNELEVSYINQIASKVRSEWRYRGAKDDWSCRVYVLQDEKGEVKSVDVRSCNIDNDSKAKSFKDSIERAVYKASPFPSAPDEKVFDAEVSFDFKVN